MVTALRSGCSTTLFSRPPEIAWRQTLMGWEAFVGATGVPKLHQTPIESFVIVAIGGGGFGDGLLRFLHESFRVTVGLEVTGEDKT